MGIGQYLIEMHLCFDPVIPYVEMNPDFCPKEIKKIHTQVYSFDICNLKNIGSKKAM